MSRKIAKVLEILDSLHDIGISDLKFELTKCEEYRQGCLAASKFKSGDRLVLVKDIDLTHAWGWEHCKHFLIKGEKVTVDSYDYFNGQYVYDVIFDNESFISAFDNQTYFIKKKHTFAIEEYYFEKLVEQNKSIEVCDNPEFSHWYEK